VTGPVAGAAPGGAIRFSAPISGEVVCSVMKVPLNSVVLTKLH
jgi:hypothetical protein